MALKPTLFVGVYPDGVAQAFVDKIHELEGGTTHTQKGRRRGYLSANKSNTVMLAQHVNLLVFLGSWLR